MIFFIWLPIVLALAAAAFVWHGIRAKNRELKRLAGERYPSGYTCIGDARIEVGIILAVCILGCWVACLVCTGILTSDNLDARRMALMLPTKEAQRHDLIATVETQLSNDQYAQLVGITDPGAFVVFAQATAVSDFLIARGGQIVALNAEIYNLRNELAEQRIMVCNNLDNPFYPRLPFIGPDCEIATDVTP